MCGSLVLNRTGLSVDRLDSVNSLMRGVCTCGSSVSVFVQLGWFELKQFLTCVLDEMLEFELYDDSV